MRKKYECRVMFGDGDLYTNLEYITDNLAECQLLEYFLKEDIPSLCNSDEDIGEELISIVNELNQLMNIVLKEHGKEINDEIFFEASHNDIRDVLDSILYNIDDLFEWSFYEIGYQGIMESYKITPLEKQSMTKKEASKLIYDEIGLEIEIID